MANWKKVLVSGSDIVVNSITASNVPAGTAGGAAPDLVLTLDTVTGGLRTVSQSAIQGVTTANFTLAAQSGTPVTFDATSDQLLITGANGLTTTIVENPGGTITTIGIELPAGTISQSQQVNLANTNGFTAFSASLAGELHTASLDNATNTAAVNTATATIANLVITASNLNAASSSIASQLETNNTNITSIQGSVSSLNEFTSSVVVNSQTGSFLISESVIGTAAQIEVTQNGAQGIQIGLPNNVTISGQLEAANIFINGQQQQESAISVISGSTIFGNNIENTHQFTGSVNITGALDIDNANHNITIDSLPTNNAANIGGLVHINSQGQLRTAGAQISTQISGAFTAFSASLAADIASIDTTTTTNNSSAITSLQNISSSLLLSASAGIFFSASNGGESLGLTSTASFAASGPGLAVSVVSLETNGIGIEYSIDPAEIASSVGAFSSSAQLQETLDTIYVQLSDAPISSSQQIQALGFITASDFNGLQNVPTGLISGAANGTLQGTFTLNGDTTISLPGLTTNASPTFKNVTVTNNLIVNGTTTELQVNELNIEDQFLLINSGANGGEDIDERDGGIIVDQGDGSGALLMYDAGAQAWAFRGATDANKVSYNETSIQNSAVGPDVFIATVNQEATGDGVAPTAAPVYGTGDFQKGQMHINTSDSTIWIYA